MTDISYESSMLRVQPEGDCFFVLLSGARLRMREQEANNDDGRKENRSVRNEVAGD